MSETVTHTRGAETVLNPITGEPPGIKEILEQRTAEGRPPEESEARQEQPKEDEAERAARQVADLRRERDEARATAAEADRARVVAENARQQALRGAEDTGFTAVATALAAKEQERDSLSLEFKAAGEAGDYAKMADLNVRLGEIGADIRDLSRGKQEFERTRQTRLTQSEQPQVRTVQADTATERRILSQLQVTDRQEFLRQRTPATRDFLQKHPEFFTDPVIHDKIVGADAYATKTLGHKLDSPEYFREVEKAIMGDTQEATRRESREPTYGTPPSREAAAPSGRRSGGDVFVSAQQKQIATWMGVDPVEYAREEAELKRVGALPHVRR